MKNTANNDLTARYRAGIDVLAEFMLPERYATLCRAADSRTHYMTVLAENIFHDQNAAALMRHCEAFGVQRLHTVESVCPFEPNPTIARGTEQWVDLVRHASTTETFDVARGPFALVFGTEHAGISDEAVAQADEFLRIPMCGMVESLNVSASAAILIYQLAARMRDTVPAWRLDEAARAELLYRWMRRSVKDADAILIKKLGIIV